MADLLFYQKPIGGTSYFGSLERCISEKDAKNMYDTIETTYSNVTHPKNLYGKYNNVVICTTSSTQTDKLITMDKADTVFFEVYFPYPTLTGSTTSIQTFVEGEMITFSMYIYNRFNYQLNLPNGVTILPHYFNSNNESSGQHAFSSYFIVSSSLTINGNSNQTVSFTTEVKSPIITGGTIYNSIGMLPLALGHDVLVTSGNTNIGKNLTAIPSIRLANNRPWAIPVLKRPYVVLSRSGTGDVITGQTLTITAKVYNANNNGVSLFNVKTKLSLSGSGLSSGPGTIKYGSGTASTTAETTISMIAETTNYSSITNTAITFTYTAPSSTSNGVVTITPTVPSWRISGNSFENLPGSGGTLTLNIKAVSDPQYYYYPFRVYGVNGTQYTGVDDLAGHIVNLSDNNATSCACWDDGGGYCDSQCVSAVVSSVTNGSSDRVYYARVATADTTTYFENLYITEFYDGGTNEGGSSEIYRTTGSTYAAFNAAGITSIYLSDIADEVALLEIVPEKNGEQQTGYLQFNWLSQDTPPESVLSVQLQPITGGTAKNCTYIFGQDGSTFTPYSSNDKIHLMDIDDQSGEYYITELYAGDKTQISFTIYGHYNGLAQAEISPVSISSELLSSDYYRYSSPSWYEMLNRTDRGTASKLVVDNMDYYRGYGGYSDAIDFLRDKFGINITSIQNDEQFAGVLQKYYHLLGSKVYAFDAEVTVDNKSYYLWEIENTTNNDHGPTLINRALAYQYLLTTNNQVNSLNNAYPLGQFYTVVGNPFSYITDSDYVSYSADAQEFNELYNLILATD